MELVKQKLWWNEASAFSEKDENLIYEYKDSKMPPGNILHIYYTFGRMKKEP